MNELIEQLASEDADRRADAAERICREGKSAAAAAVPLVQACGDSDERVREWAVAALEEIGPPPPGSIDRMMEFAGGGEPLSAYWATTLLGRSGKDAAKAVPVLANCIESSADPSVRQRAAWAIGKIGPSASSARAVLERATASDDPRLARLAAEALGAIGP